MDRNDPYCIASGVTLIPVFCTAEIPPEALSLPFGASKLTASQTLNDLLDSTLRYSNPQHGHILSILTSKDPASLSAITHGSQSPTPAFHSPFIGLSLEQVRDFFVSTVKPIKAFTKYTFVVLDEQSQEEESCIVASVMDEPLEQLRCDFNLPIQFAQPSEMGVNGLTETIENVDRVWTAKDMGVLPRY